MGRSAECERLVAWTVGKPYLLGLFAPTIAYAADDIDRLIRTPEGAAMRSRLAEVSDPNRRRYYRSALDLMRDMATAAAEPEGEMLRGLCDALTELLDPALDRRALVQQVIASLRDRQSLAAVRQDWSEEVAANCAELTAPSSSAISEAERQAVEASPAISFLVNLMLGYLVRNHQLPQQQYRLVSENAGVSFRVVRPLLENDPQAPWLSAIARRLRSPRAEDARRLWKFAAPVLARGPRELNRVTVVRSLAGLISFVSYALDAPLKAPAIRQLFDWAADQRARAAGDKRGAPRGDLRLPVGETLTKCLERERKAWMAHLDPDENFRASVRALRGLAA